MDARRQAVLDEAMTWQGTPWRHNECVKGLTGGVDCGRFPLAVYRDLGLIDNQVVDDYPIDWALKKGAEERYLTIVKRYCIEVEVPQSGDLVVFKYGHTFSHGGIVINYPNIIHALRANKAGVVLDSANQGELKRRERVFYSYFAKVQ